MEPYLWTPAHASSRIHIQPKYRGSLFTIFLVTSKTLEWFLLFWQHLVQNNVYSKVYWRISKIVMIENPMQSPRIPPQLAMNIIIGTYKNGIILKTKFISQPASLCWPGAFYYFFLKRHCSPLLAICSFNFSEPIFGFISLKRKLSFKAHIH